MGGSYWQNVRRTLVPEFISMNAMMAGMAPVMSFLMMGRDMRAMQPWEPLFWGVMSLGVIVGFAVAYAPNVWMVAKLLKHGLMTGRKEKEQESAPARHREGHRRAAGNEHARGGNPGGDEHLAHAEGISAKAHSGGERKEHSQRADGGGQKGHADHAGPASGGGHGGMQLPPAFAPTVAQQVALSGVTGLMLVAGIVVPSFYVNLGLDVYQVGGTIMPPGMIMDFNTPADNMRSMGAVHPRDVSYKAPPEARGDRPLAARIENGVKVFDIEASVIRWNILPWETVEAYAYNRQILGPRLEVAEGDRVRINVHNSLPETTTIHWHGLILPNEMDGPAGITQEPIPPGGAYVYEFTVGQSGTFFYHTHNEPDRQQALGLYGALIIAPGDPAAAPPAADYDITVMLQEWLKREWLTYPAMLMEGALPNFFTINGKAYPATDVVRMRVSETLKVRFIGSNNNFIHPMHIHGGPFEVVAVDGETLRAEARYFADTVNVGPGQRFDVIWTAHRPGKWLLHCHIPHHTENNNVEVDGAGGLTMIIDVS